MGGAGGRTGGREAGATEGRVVDVVAVERAVWVELEGKGVRVLIVEVDSATGTVECVV